MSDSDENPVTTVSKTPKRKQLLRATKRASVQVTPAGKKPGVTPRKKDDSVIGKKAGTPAKKGKKSLKVLKGKKEKTPAKKVEDEDDDEEDDMDLNVEKMDEKKNGEGDEDMDEGMDDDKEVKKVIEEGKNKVDNDDKEAKKQINGASSIDDNCNGGSEEISPKAQKRRRESIDDDDEPKTKRQCNISVGSQAPKSCYNCNEQGHRAFDCPKPKDKGCFNCGELGHRFFECKKDDPLKKPSDTARDEKNLKELFIGNLPKDVTEQELKALSPDIISVHIPNESDFAKNRCAFLTFASEAKAEENHNLLKQQKFRGEEINVDFTGAKRQNKDDGSSRKIGKPNSVQKLDCYNCNKHGHRSFECPESKRSCFNCGKKGHKSFQCKEKKKGKSWKTSASMKFR